MQSKRTRTTSKSSKLFASKNELSDDLEKQEASDLREVESEKEADRPGRTRENLAKYKIQEDQYNLVAGNMRFIDQEDAHLANGYPDQLATSELGKLHPVCRKNLDGEVCNLNPEQPTRPSQKWAENQKDQVFGID